MGHRVAALSAVLLLAGCTRVIDGRGAVEPSQFRKRLSHVAVERFIEEAVTPESPVVCNDGRDFPLRHAGETFTCVAGDRPFTVTITDPASGSYKVS